MLKECLTMPNWCYNRVNIGCDTEETAEEVLEFLKDHEQVVDILDGYAEGDFSGHSVRLSADGSVVAIGANRNEKNELKRGQVNKNQKKTSE